jgi:hypothetical protein
MSFGEMDTPERVDGSEFEMLRLGVPRSKHPWRSNWREIFPPEYPGVSGRFICFISRHLNTQGPEDSDEPKASAG